MPRWPIGQRWCGELGTLELLRGIRFTPLPNDRARGTIELDHIGHSRAAHVLYREFVDAFPATVMPRRPSSKPTVYTFFVCPDILDDEGTQHDSDNLIVSLSKGKNEDRCDPNALYATVRTCLLRPLVEGCPGSTRGW